jgi:GrpB-like predicted nucleotidyltransferase (UPF0157 family)
MSIGLIRGTVALELHCPEWEASAEQTIELLKRLISDTAMDIQHIGSTAIRGISAKPIIDIAVGVARLGDILKMNDILAENGFIFRGQDLPDQYLYVCGWNDFRTHHIHVLKYGSAPWNNYLDIRDYLNCHEADAQAYSDLKESLARQYPEDRLTYTQMKSEFISAILRKAKDWRAQTASDNTEC